MRQYLININGSGGAYVPISAKSVVRRLEMIEDSSANAGVFQGITYQFDDGSGTVPNTPSSTVYTVIPSAIQPEVYPVVIGEAVPENMGYGRVIGTPPDNSGGYSIPATVLANVRSATATATVLRVTEYN
jgi:hypothetical protein